MRTYILKRILLFIPTVLAVMLLVFVVLRLIPGDPALQILEGSGEEGFGGGLTQEELTEQISKLRAEFGTDRSIVIQFLAWVWNMLQGDFGRSYLHNTSITADLKKKLPISVELAVLAMMASMVVAVPLGVFSAVKQDQLGDYIARIVTVLGVAMPTFWTGILFIFFLVDVFRWAPPLGYADLWDDPAKNLQQVIFPAIALGFYNMAFVARITRSALLEVLREDYIRTARSKGVSEGVVIGRHGLKNAFLPVLTVAGIQFGNLVTGTVIIETIFQVPGIGQYLITSIQRRDYAQTQAIVLIISLMIVSLNLIVDLVYGWLDPRIRYQ